MVTELNVTPITRRRFVQQTVSATVALSGARWILGEREQNASPLDAAAIRKLASEISGHVITTESPDYESARLVFNRAFDLRPALLCAAPALPTLRGLSILLRAGIRHSQCVAEAIAVRDSVCAIAAWS